MSAEHNHQPRCCCPTNYPNPGRDHTHPCPSCPDHGGLHPGDPGYPADPTDHDLWLAEHDGEDTTDD
jgi:hypothetical protein